MNKFKRNIFGALLCSSIIAISGCSNKDTSDGNSNAEGKNSVEVSSEVKSDVEKDVIRFTWWGSQDRHDYTNEMLKAYEEKNPNITFEVTPSSWDGYFEKLSTQAAGGTMPDLLQMDYLYISTYAKNGTLTNLQPYVDSKDIDLTYIDEDLANSGRIDDTLAGMAFSTSMLAVAYNPDVLVEAGLEEPSPDWTWTDFLEMGKVVKEKTGKYGFDWNMGDINAIRYWVRQYGYELFNKDSTALGFDDVNMLAELFQYQLDLQEAGVVPSPDERIQLSSLDILAQPIAVKEQAGGVDIMNIPVVIESVNDTTKLQVLPNVEGGQPALYSKPGIFLSIAETSEIKGEAAKFIDWFMNSEESYDIMGVERGTPANSEIREYLRPSLSKQQNLMMDYVDFSEPYRGSLPAPDPEGTSEMNDKIVNYRDQMFYGVITPTEAAEAFMKDANEILAKNN
ncbi:MAG: ABC transporter substrate-binding protein [Lachnospirales bacterium]